MLEVPLDEHGSIPHYVEAVYRSSKVILRPAGPGTGVIAGGAVRAVMELAGVRNVLTKIIGSSNAVNVVRATVVALESLGDPAERRNARLVAVDLSNNGD
jgi:small subunit ribosomal protein S5